MQLISSLAYICTMVLVSCNIIIILYVVLCIPFVCKYMSSDKVLIFEEVRSKMILFNHPVKPIKTP